MKRTVFILIASALAASVPAGSEKESLTLRQAVALALESSPELAMFSAELRAAEARVVQAGLPPNPEAEVLLEDFAGSGNFSGADELQTTLQLSQVIELGGKRDSRRDAAAAARDLVGSEYELKRIEVLADVAEKFITVIGAQQRLTLAKEATAAMESALNAVRKRVAAGKTPALEKKKAAIALARGRIVEEHAEQ